MKALTLRLAITALVTGEARCVLYNPFRWHQPNVSSVQTDTTTPFQQWSCQCSLVLFLTGHGFASLVNPEPSKWQLA